MTFDSLFRRQPVDAAPVPSPATPTPEAQQNIVDTNTDLFVKQPNLVACNEQTTASKSDDNSLQLNQQIKPNTTQSQQQQQQQQQQQKDHSSINLSFAGCGFLGMYHVGVASCFKEYAPQISTKTISGSSAGALVAMSHICGTTQLGFITTDTLKVAMDARKRPLGPLHPAFDLHGTVAEALDRGLPDDAHIKATGLLNVSLTRVSDGANVIVNEFETRAELIDALLCSCFIPLYSGFSAPKLRGVAYVDGGFSNNLLIIDEKTVTVSPFSGESDICPQDSHLSDALMQLNVAGTSIAVSPTNLQRISNALLPPPPEVLKKLCQQGFDDGMRYLQRNKLISCNRCLNIKSPANINVNVDEIKELETLDSQRNRFDIRKQRQRYNSESSSDNSDSSDLESEIDSDFSSMPDIASDFESLGTSTMSSASDYDDCDDCRRRRQMALAETLPQIFLDKLIDACESVNKSLYHWICSHRPIKYLSYLAVPYYLPLDLTLALFVRVWHAMPSYQTTFISCLSRLINLLLDLALKLEAANRRSTTSLLWNNSTKTPVNAIETNKGCDDIEAQKVAALKADEQLLKAAVDLQEEQKKHFIDNQQDNETMNNNIQNDNQTTTASNQDKVHPFYLLVDSSKLSNLTSSQTNTKIIDDNSLIGDTKTSVEIKLIPTTTTTTTTNNNNNDLCKA